MGSAKSWRDITRQARQKRAAATPPPQAVHIPDELDPIPVPIVHVPVTIERGLQQFTYTPQAQPRSHQLTIRLNTTGMWQVLEATIAHLRERRVGPLEITFVGLLEDISTPETEADNADDPSYGTPV
jgi:hypothetical protein